MIRLRSLPPISFKNKKYKQGHDACPNCGESKQKKSKFCSSCNKILLQNQRNKCECGRSKNIRLPYCQQCIKSKGITRDPQKEICPKCGERKRSGTILCLSCSNEERRQKPCPSCGKPYNEKDFIIKNPTRSYPNGKRQGKCKECSKEDYLPHNRKSSWKRKGLNPEKVLDLLENHNGRCDICGTKTPLGQGECFKVDHDHKSGKLRGLLCNNCNCGLGHFKDDPVRLRKAIKYLKSHKGENHES